MKKFLFLLSLISPVLLNTAERDERPITPIFTTYSNKDFIIQCQSDCQTYVKVAVKSINHIISTIKYEKNDGYYDIIINNQTITSLGFHPDSVTCRQNLNPARNPHPIVTIVPPHKNLFQKVIPLTKSKANTFVIVFPATRTTDISAHLD